MTFLQPYILWGLPLLLIPVIIHLINRLRHRPQPWAAMRFVISATRSSISQAKLRQFLILLFRVLAVLALIIFLGRPLAGGWLGWALAPAPDAVLLVLDRSASMETTIAALAKTRREHTLDLWGEALRQFPPSTRLILFESAGRLPQILPGVSSLTLPQFTGPTDTASDVPGLLLRAFEYLLESKTGAAEIWIASDLQASNWIADDPRWETVVTRFASLPQKVRFRMLSFEPGGADNTSLTLVEALPQQRAGANEIAAVLDLQRNTLTNEPVVLEASLNGTRSQVKIDLSERSFRSRVALPLPSSQTNGWGSFQLPADANARDNRAYFVFEPEKPAHALIVASDSRGALPLTLAAADFSKADLQPAPVVSPEELPRQDLNAVSLIVWSADLPQNTSQQLTSFIEAGGIVLCFPSAPQPGTALAGFSWGQPVHGLTAEPMRVAKWNEVDGPLARTEEGLAIPLTQLEVTQRAPISGGGTILASFTDGAPFLVRKTLGKGAVYFCATVPQEEWSDLGSGSILVPLLQRLHLAGARRLNAALSFECGQADLGADTRRWTSVDSSEPKDPRFQAGVYRSNNRLIAINRPAAEDTPEAVPAADVAKLFGSLSFQLLQDQGRAEDRLQGEVWRFFVFAMLLFLLVEGLLILPGRDSAPPAPTGRVPGRSGLVEKPA